MDLTKRRAFTERVVAAGRNAGVDVHPQAMAEGTATAAHRSGLVLFKINGTQHAYHVALSHVNPDLSISPGFPRAQFRESFFQSFQDCLVDSWPEIIIHWC